MNASANDLFAGMDDLDSAPSKPTRSRKDIVTIKCPICNGSGRKVYGYVNIQSFPCGCCKGKGTLSQERLNRYQGAKKGAATAAKNLRERQLAFQKDNPVVWEWLGRQVERGTNDFARSLYDQVMDRGRLTENQIAAVHRSIEKAKATREANQANAPKVGEGALKMLDVFKTARANGFKKPKVRTEHFDFSLAPDAGANTGFIYVKSHYGQEYLGKIGPDGKFLGRNVDASTTNLLMEVCADPLDAAVKFGAKTGVCSCCGRDLTNKESVELGIGPICREKFFGG